MEHIEYVIPTTSFLSIVKSRAVVEMKRIWPEIQEFETCLTYLRFRHAKLKKIYTEADRKQANERIIKLPPGTTKRKNLNKQPDINPSLITKELAEAMLAEILKQQRSQN